MNTTCPLEKVTVSCSQSYSGSLILLQWVVREPGSVRSAGQESFVSLASMTFPLMGQGISFGGVMFKTTVVSIQPTLVSTLMYTATRELNTIEVSCTVTARQGSDSQDLRQDLIIVGVGEYACKSDHRIRTSLLKKLTQRPLCMQDNLTKFKILELPPFRIVATHPW